MTWTRVATRAELDGRDVLGVVARGHRVALYRLADGVFATSDACPHLGGSLSQGTVVEGFIECPLHYALFDIRTGASGGGVTTRSVRTLPTRIDGDDVYVDLSGLEETGP